MAGTIAVAVIAFGAVTQVILGHVRDNRQAHSISQEEYDSVSTGTPTEALIARFGVPEEGHTAGLADSCISYKQRGEPLLQERDYEFCFRSGRLSFKVFSPVQNPALLRGVAKGTESQ